MTVVCENLYQYCSYTFCSLLKCNTRFAIALLSPLSQINRWQSIAAGWRSGFTTQIKTAKTTAHLSDKMRRGLILCQVVNGADHSVWFQRAIQRRDRQRERERKREGEREREGILSEGNAETNPTRDERRRVNHSCHFSISALMPRPVKTPRREENSFPLKKSDSFWGKEKKKQPSPSSHLTQHLWQGILLLPHMRQNDCPSSSNSDVHDNKLIT